MHGYRTAKSAMDKSATVPGGGERGDAARDLHRFEPHGLTPAYRTVEYDLSSKVNLPHTVDLLALCGANLNLVV